MEILRYFGSRIDFNLLDAEILGTVFILEKYDAPRNTKLLIPWEARTWVVKRDCV